MAHFPSRYGSSPKIESMISSIFYNSFFILINELLLHIFDDGGVLWFEFCAELLLIRIPKIFCMCLNSLYLVTLKFFPFSIQEFSNMINSREYTFYSGYFSGISISDEGLWIR